MTIKGIIFDFDGTLIDSMKVWDPISDIYLKRKGIQNPPKLKERLKLATIGQTAEYFKEKYNFEDDVKTITADIYKIFEHEYINGARLKESVNEMLSAFSKENVRMCIATTADRHLAEEVLQRLNIHHFFSDIITSGEVGSSKDRPEIFETALEKIGTAKDNTLIIDDSLYAIQTAKKAGFKVVAVHDENSEKDTPQIKELADIYLKSFKEEIKL
ncbi:HAD superfamily hydrolase (TIGR01509 family) [Elusimicrobium posterum]|uniref:HAD family hydrolase n=1 Tax=Elusimicrobium posterum TaxID=3116653 RepID=UPI003C75535E